MLRGGGSEAERTGGEESRREEARGGKGEEDELEGGASPEKNCCGSGDINMGLLKKIDAEKLKKGVRCMKKRILGEKP